MQHVAFSINGRKLRAYVNSNKVVDADLGSEIVSLIFTKNANFHLTYT